MAIDLTCASREFCGIGRRQFVSGGSRSSER